MAHPKKVKPMTVEQLSEAVLVLQDQMLRLAQSVLKEVTKREQLRAGVEGLVEHVNKEHKKVSDHLNKNFQTLFDKDNELEKRLEVVEDRASTAWDKI